MIYRKVVCEKAYSYSEPLFTEEVVWVEVTGNPFILIIRKNGTARMITRTARTGHMSYPGYRYVTKKVFLIGDAFNARFDRIMSEYYMCLSQLSPTLLKVLEPPAAPAKA
jgi:hypothetical protein